MLLLGVVIGLTLAGILFAWVVFRDMQHGVEIKGKHLVEEFERMEK